MTRVRAACPADADAVAAVGRVAFTRQYEGLVDPANYTWAARDWYSDRRSERAVRGHMVGIRFGSTTRSGGPELVGRWERVQSCRELAHAYDQAHLSALAPATLGSDWFGETSGRQLARKKDLWRAPNPRAATRTSSPTTARSARSISMASRSTRTPTASSTTTRYRSAVTASCSPELGPWSQLARLLRIPIYK